MNTVNCQQPRVGVVAAGGVALAFNTLVGKIVEVRWPYLAKVGGKANRG